MGTPLYRPRDLAHNNLSAYTQVPIIGYIEPSELLDPDRLNQRIYDFLLRSIREDDKKSGELLKRYLQGPQDVWERIQARLFEVKTLWSVTEIEDELLKYLKNIVGWTHDLEYITDRMGFDQLRRLISVSVALWKAKGPEDTIEDLLRFILQSRVRILSWFDYRWLIEENYLTLESQGLDTWLLDAPEDGTEQNYSVLKIVDDGTMDRTLARYLLGLLRAAGERIEVHYLKFMDLFDTNGDVAQWSTFVGGLPNPLGLVVDGGTAKLSNSVTNESTFITNKDTFLWGDYAISAKIRANAVTTGRYGLWLHAQEPWSPEGIPINGHKIYLDPAANQVRFNNAPASFTPWGTLYPDVYYNLTVRVTDVDGTDMLYEIYVDGEFIFSVTEDQYRFGYVGLRHEDDAVLEVGEIEVAPIPPDTELIDINS